jgi:hypothetical protein
VWHVTATDYEYVWVIPDGAGTGRWEELGAPHNFASSTHKHDVTITGTNAASTATVSGTVPKATVATKYIHATASTPGVTAPTKAALGANATFSVSGGAPTKTTVNVNRTTSVAVGANGTAQAITAFGTNTTEAVIGTDTGHTVIVGGGAAANSKMVTSTASKVTPTTVTVKSVKTNTTVTASKLSSSGTVGAGSAASWSATVASGVLTFAWTANAPTTVTLPTFSNVTASKVATESLNTSQVTATDVTVATGSLSSTGTGASVTTGVSAVTVDVDHDATDVVDAVTGLGTPTKTTVLTGVKVTTQPAFALQNSSNAKVTQVVTDVSAITVSANSKDTVNAVTSVTVGAPTITLSKNTTSDDDAAAVTDTTETTQSVTLTGTAAAQKWTFNSASVSGPVDN